MLKFTQLLTPETLRHNVICASKKRAFEMLGQMLAKEHIHDDPSQEEKQKEMETYYTECLFTREKIGYSDLGNGIAMPKGRIEQGEKPLAGFLQLAQGVDYGADSLREVDLIFALLIPSHLCQSIAPHLANLSQRLTDKKLYQKLRNAESSEALWQCFLESDEEAEKMIENQQENTDIPAEHNHQA